MNVKIIAIGNPIMMDDGIGISVVKELEEWITENEIEIIIGETDMDYCMDYIGDGDFIIIIDATNLGYEPCHVTTCPIRELDDDYRSGYSQHEMSILKGLTLYGKKVEGYFIGIEIGKIEYGCELSDILQRGFMCICDNVKEEIEKILRGSINA